MELVSSYVNPSVVAGIRHEIECAPDVLTFPSYDRSRLAAVIELHRKGHVRKLQEVMVELECEDDFDVRSTGRFLLQGLRGELPMITVRGSGLRLTLIGSKEAQGALSIVFPSLREADLSVTTVDLEEFGALFAGGLATECGAVEHLGFTLEVLAKLDPTSAARFSHRASQTLLRKGLVCWLVSTTSNN